MAEKPILFSTEMVRAILEGRKTQTRRVVKPVGKDEGFVVVETDTGELCPFRSYDGESWDDGNGCEVAIDCPYGAPGDTLWVREKYWIVERDGQGIDVPFLVYDDEWERGVVIPGTPLRPWVGPFLKYGPRPSIHMPRWASRITLRVKGVRVERLQEISEEDAQAEGVVYHDGRGIGHSGWRPYDDFGMVGPTPIHAFAWLWQSINGPESWAANPWVWVGELEKEAANG